MAISVPTGRMRKCETNVGHVRNFKRGEIEGYMESQGYRAISIAYAGFPFYSPIYREICNIGDFGSSEENISTEFGFFKQWLSKILFLMFYKLSSKNNKGDQFIGIFENVKFQEIKGDKFYNDRV